MKSISDLKVKYLVQKIKDLFSPKEHTHDLTSDVNGVLQPANGGTGANDIEEFFKNNLADGCQIRAVVKSYEGVGSNEMKICFEKGFYPLFVVIVSEEGSGGMPLTIVPYGGSFYMNGLSGFNTSSNLNTAYINYTYEGQTIDGVGYNVVTITSSNVSAAIQIFNNEAENYRMFAIGSTKSSFGKCSVKFI